MVLCVRKDLPMTKGKACAQCCHAAVGAVNRARRTTKGLLSILFLCLELYKAWQRSGCKKVALQCPDEATFMELCTEAEKAGLVYYAVVVVSCLHDSSAMPGELNSSHIHSLWWRSDQIEKSV